MQRLGTTLGLALGLLLALVGLAPAAGAQGQRAQGTLVAGDGRTIGAVQLEQTASGVAVRVTYGAIDVVAPGTHGIHFHAVGRCDGPDFMSAGPHYNPTNRQHGFDNPDGYHAGDLPSLVTDASTAQQSGYLYTATTTDVTLAPGPTSLFDADGTALVIHANADDNVSDPAGNSGGRVACAVLTQAAAMPGLPNTGAGGAGAVPAPWWQAVLLGALTLATTAAALRVARRA